MLNADTAKSLFGLYFFGQPHMPEAEARFDINEHYNTQELDELELNSLDNEDRPKNILYHLNCDWDSFQGSLRNSSTGIFDAFFSSIGSIATQNLDFKSKLGITASTFLGAFAAGKFKIPFISDKISLFHYAGRLARSPLHLFDSAFSAIGESWSESSIANIATLGLGALGIRNSYKNPKDFQENSELDYQTISGTLARSSLHHLQSLISSFGQTIFAKAPILGTLATVVITALNSKVPQSIKEHHISWKSLNGLLGQNLFHFTDSLYSGLGSLVSKEILKSKALSLLTLPALVATSFLPDLEKKMSEKLIFTKLGAKATRSMMHGLDTIVFNLGTQFAKTKLALPFLGAYGLLSYSSSLNKDLALAKIPEFKIPLNEIGSLLHRLPFDFVESVISESSNKLSKKIPAPLLVLFGPALSFQLGKAFKDAKTPFNSSTGLVLKHLLHFWDNLLTSAGYQTGKSVLKLFGLSAKQNNSGSILSDGRWLSDEGRIISKMALGKQLAQN